MDFAVILKAVNDFVWGPFMLVLLVGTGVFLTIRLNFLPWRNLGFALKSIFKDPDKEGMVHFIGMMLLFALMFFTFFNDIRKLFG